MLATMPKKLRYILRTHTIERKNQVLLLSFDLYMCAVINSQMYTHNKQINKYNLTKFLLGRKSKTQKANEKNKKVFIQAKCESAPLIPVLGRQGDHWVAVTAIQDYSRISYRIKHPFRVILSVSLSTVETRVGVET